MSTCYQAKCLVCNNSIHLGTRFAGSLTFGHSAKDDEGREAAMDFIVQHDHGHKTNLRILSEYHPDYTPDPA